MRSGGAFSVSAALSLGTTLNQSTATRRGAFAVSFWFPSGFYRAFIEFENVRFKRGAEGFRGSVANLLDP